MSQAEYLCQTGAKPIRQAETRRVLPSTWSSLGDRDGLIIDLELNNTLSNDMARLATSMARQDVAEPGQFSEQA